MRNTKLKIDTISHSGWESYYKEQRGKRAWNGVPDEYLLEHLDDILPAPGSSIIDIASGDGRNTVPFLDRGYKIVSTDLSLTALVSFKDRCCGEGAEIPILIAGDFMAMEFAENQFQCAVCFNAISHFPSIPKTLEKMVGLLAKGGKAVFNAFTPNDVSFGLGEKIQKDTFVYKNTLFTFTSEKEVKEMLSTHSVKVIHSETRRWEESDHGSYRTGTHTHEACFFIAERG